MLTLHLPPPLLKSKRSSMKEFEGSTMKEFEQALNLIQRSIRFRARALPSRRLAVDRKEYMGLLRRAPMGLRACDRASMRQRSTSARLHSFKPGNVYARGQYMCILVCVHGSALCMYAIL